MRVRGYRIIALYYSNEARYLRIPLHWGDIDSIDYANRKFKKSRDRTDGGWIIFKEHGNAG